jgi:hypothetical protein
MPLCLRASPSRPTHAAHRPPAPTGPARQLLRSEGPTCRCHPSPPRMRCCRPAAPLSTARCTGPPTLVPTLNKWSLCRTPPPIHFFSMRPPAVPPTFLKVVGAQRRIPPFFFSPNWTHRLGTLPLALVTHTLLMVASHREALLHVKVHEGAAAEPLTRWAAPSASLRTISYMPHPSPHPPVLQEPAITVENHRSASPLTECHHPEAPRPHHCRAAASVLWGFGPKMAHALFFTLINFWNHFPI